MLVKNKSTIGIWAVQPSRLDSCKIASDKALRFLPEKIINSVAASDAFFPFTDGVEELINAGVPVIHYYLMNDTSCMLDILNYLHK